MAQENDIIIKVEVDAERLTSETNAAIAELQKMRGEQAALNKQFKKDKISADEYGATVSANKARMQELTKTIKDNTTMLAAASVEEVKSNATLDQKRAALNALQKAYGQLTTEQKNAELGGKTMTERIKELSDAVKEEEAAIGDSRRNVGNYSEAITQAVPGLGKMQNGLNLVKKFAGLAAGGFSALAAGIKMAMLSMVKFLATPAGLIIGAIAAALALAVKAFQKLSEAIKKNDDASTALARVYAVTVQPIIDTMTKIFGKLADIVGKVANKFADWIGGLTDGQKVADSYVKSVDKLEEAERQYTVTSAERNKQIAELRNKATQADKYSVDERRKALEEALELEKQNLEDEKRIKAERLRLMEDKAQREKDTTDATKNAIANARAEMINAETNYYNATRRMQTQLASFNKEIDEEDKRRLEEYKKRIDERKKAAVEAWAQEREISIMLEGFMSEGAKSSSPLDFGEEEEDDYEQWEKKMDALIAKKKELFGENADERTQALNDDLNALEEIHEAKLISEQQYEQAVADLRAQYREEERAMQMESLAEQMTMWSDMALGTLSAISDAMAAADRAELQDYKETQDRKKKELEKQLKSGEISEAQYQSEVQRLDEETDRKEKEMQREQAKREKALNIMNAAISTAAAIIGFLANPGGIPGIAMSAMAGITGAAQIAAIAAEPLPQFASGGIVGGTSYTGDNVLARVNSGELILPQDKAAMLFDAVSGNAQDTSLGFNYAEMAAAMSAQPAPVVVYSEMRQFEQRVATYDEIARI